jgi:alanine dehydrogenase
MGGYVYAAGFGSGTVWFVAPLFDADTGEPLAVLDGAAMNPGKTAAAGAVGTDALARPDASTVGLIGSGRQARAALRATATVRDLDRVRVQSPTPAHRRELAADPPVDVPHEAVDAPAAAVRDADIVITVTTASEPVFDGDDLRPGTHVTAMGQYHPDRRELDATTVARLTV